MIEQASLVIGEGNWAVKSDSLLGYKINGGKYYPREMSVVRATTGTRINEDGLVEVVPYNLLQYSEDFSNAVYNKIDIQTVTTGITDPNGGTTGVRLIPFVGFNGVVTQSFSTAIGSTYTLTFWMKGNANGVLNVNYNGAVLSPQNNVSYTTQWQQFQYTFTADSNSSQILFGGFFTWASGQQLDFTFAQLNEGTSALDYLPTTDRLDVARIDYSSGSAALLVEPQRTNLALWSSSFDNAAWDKVGGTMTANATTAPDGNTTAEQWAGDGANTVHDFYQIFTGGSTTTSSIYVKKNTAQFVYISLNHQSSGADWATGVYDLDNLTTATFQSGGVTNQVATISDEGNGWRRITLSVSTTDVNLYCMYGIADSLSPSFIPFRGRISFSTSASFYIWGAQLELGSYATSLIPTQAATVTRNADAVYKTGASSLIGQTEGVIYIDVLASAKNVSGTTYAFFYLFGDATNNIQLYYISGILYVYVVVSSSVVINTSTSQTITENTRYKMAMAYKSGQYALYVNGSQIFVNTASAVPTMSQFNFNATGFGALAAETPNNYNATALWKTRLTNAQLATLTTI